MLRSGKLTLVRRATQASPRYYPCPVAGNRTQLCFALCRPVAGFGECGRLAGHAFLGRTQLAILRSRRPPTTLR